MRQYRGAATALAVVLAACSGGGHRATVAPRPAAVEAWRAAGIKPIGQPVLAGGTLVVYGTQDQDLYLYGVSPADGAILWKRAATPSRTLQGTALTPEVLDGHVVYFRPDAKGVLMARLVVALPDTGNDLLVSDPMFFASHPSHCADGADICVRAYGPGRPLASQRFSVQAHGPVADAMPPPPDSRFLGEDLLDVGTRAPEMLAGFHDGATRWRAPLSRYFPAGYTSDHGWYFELFKTEQLHVGGVASSRARTEGSVTTVDLSMVQTVGIEATTGVLAWKAEGASMGCDAKIQLDRKVAEDRWEPWPVRCRYRGTLRYDSASGAVTYEGLDVTLEGFEVPTGKTLWSVPLGAAEAFMKEDHEPPAAGDSEVLVQSASGPLIVDLSTGAARPPVPDRAFWCESTAQFDYHEPRNPGEVTSQWRGGTMLDPCGPDGSPTDTVPAHASRSVARVGQRTVVATSQGLVAYDHP
jgi:hypothetical protein